MKSILTVAASFFSLAMAGASSQRLRQDPPALGTQFYQLRTSSNEPAFNEQWISLLPNSMDIRPYVLGSSQDAASRFFLVNYNATNTWELRAAEDANRQAVLHGRNQSSELLYMEDVVQPGASGVLEGELAEWGVFVLDYNILGVKDGSALTERSFVAVHPETADGQYEVAFYDGASNTSLPPVTHISLNFMRLPRG